MQTWCQLWQTRHASVDCIFKTVFRNHRVKINTLLNKAKTVQRTVKTSNHDNVPVLL